MKAMIIPIVIGLLAGIGGGSGYSYMKASAKYVADSTRIADSLKTHADSAAHDSTEHAAGEDSTAHGAADSTLLAEQAPMTPADSLRALEAARKAGTSHAPADHGPAARGASAHAPAPAKAESHTSTPAPPTPKPSTTSSAAASVKDARDQALQTALPEARLAKIFGAMAPKDAAKVLDQMTDGDVRAILAMMNDRQAAAILSAFSAGRAAAITKGAVKSPGNPTP
ncbi:hypothetical protein GEMMAAP_02345 [Gemmatimonas phototrophica]|uniref:Magnesium transporter MgtE intracellular domain-containing protein n=2 Tax=Gemmatimonas phototrophica TaxID=1379270 RepID=A0A143BG35_9BACT|nr:hypothetical protein GEMMAAP_02345 [Gemmatimonas phototrophica]